MLRIFVTVMKRHVKSRVIGAHNLAHNEDFRYFEENELEALGILCEF